MFRNEVARQNKLIAQVKGLWENDHGDEMTEAYNQIIEVMSKLDVYSANILVNLIWLQTAQKTYLGTVGKKDLADEIEEKRR